MLIGFLLALGCSVCYGTATVLQAVAARSVEASGNSGVNAVLLLRAIQQWRYIAGIGLDGLGFLRRLRAHDDQRSVPVAIVTGDYFLDDTVSNELRELGAELRFKPLWLEDLVGLTRNLLRSRVIH